MPLAIRSIRRTRWFRPNWISNDDVPSDPLTDFSTEENVLSIWSVKNDKSNINRIISALAARRKDISNYDYLLFDQNIIDKSNIKSKQTIGKSLDEEINESSHYDLIELTANQICSLVKEAYKNGKTVRIHHKEVASMLTKSIQNGYIDKNSVSEKIRNQLSL